MRTDDRLVSQTVVPVIEDPEFAWLLVDDAAGKIDSTSRTALDDSLKRLRQGSHTSEFTSAPPDVSGTEGG